MKKLKRSKPMNLRAETVRPLVDLRKVTGGKAHSVDPCWTTRTSGGLPCTDEPVTHTCPPPDTKSPLP